MTKKLIKYTFVYKVYLIWGNNKMIKIPGHNENGHEVVYEGLRAVRYLGDQLGKYVVAVVIGLPLRALDHLPKPKTLDSRVEE